MLIVEGNTKFELLQTPEGYLVRLLVLYSKVNRES